MFQFELPDPGEGLQEAEIVRWLVSPGDEVHVNDPLVEIETAKSLVELPSPVSGTVTRLLAEVGAVVAVGSPIIEIDEPDPVPAGLPTPAVARPVEVGAGPAERGVPDMVRAMPDRPAAAGSQAATRRITPVAADRGWSEGGRAVSGHSASNAIQAAAERLVSDVIQAAAERKSADCMRAGAQRLPGAGSDAGACRAATIDDSEDEAVFPPGSGPLREAAGVPVPRRPQIVPETAATGPAGKVLAKPMVRRLARDLGVRLDQVAPTGPGGSISRADVETAAGLRPPAGRRVPIGGVRRATAQNLTDSVANHVHATEFNTIDVTATMCLVETLKQRREFHDLHVSPLLIHAKAVCLALGRHPELNASWDAGSDEICLHGQVNLGMAAATPRGLLVPVIRDAGARNLVDLCRAINELTGKARAGRLQPADQTGGTFSITNVGVFGVDTGTPIINGAESAILAMGAIKRRPWVVGSGAEEHLAPRWVTTLALGFDHRFIDGEQGARFLADVCAILTAPELALLF